MGESPVDDGVSAVRTVASDLKMLSSFGVIITELVSTSVKYAFDGVAEGRMVICAERRDLTVHIVSTDNGSGLPEAVSLENSIGFGTRFEISILSKNRK